MIPAHNHLWKLSSEPVGLTIPRPAHLPAEARDTAPIVPEGTDLAIWTWESAASTGGSYLGIAFVGKSNKPLWHYMFRTEALRQKQIDETIKSRKSWLDSKQKSLEERRTFQHGFKAGDILYSSWGYDQTNVNFYEVIEAGEKEITLREIDQKTVRKGRGSDEVTAVPGDFIGPALRRRPTSGGVKINSVQRAYTWDGKPRHQTASGWGH